MEVGETGQGILRPAQPNSFQMCTPAWPLFMDLLHSLSQ